MLAARARKRRNAQFQDGAETAFATHRKASRFSETGKYRQYSKEKAGDADCVLRADLTGGGITAAELNEVQSTSLLALNNLETRLTDLFERAHFAL